MTLQWDDDGGGDDQGRLVELGEPFALFLVH